MLTSCLPTTQFTHLLAYIRLFTILPVFPGLEEARRHSSNQLEHEHIGLGSFPEDRRRLPGGFPGSSEGCGAPAEPGKGERRVTRAFLGRSGSGEAALASLLLEGKS